MLNMLSFTLVNIYCQPKSLGSPWRPAFENTYEHDLSSASSVSVESRITLDIRIWECQWKWSRPGSFWPCLLRNYLEWHNWDRQTHAGCGWHNSAGEAM